MFRKLDRIKALPGGQLSRLNTELLQLVVTKTHPGRLREGSRRLSIKDDSRHFHPCCPCFFSWGVV